MGVVWHDIDDKPICAFSGCKFVNLRMKKTSRPSSAASTLNSTSKTVKNHAKTITTTAKKTNEKKKTETEEEKFLDFEDFLDTENFFLKVEEAQTTEINVKMNKAAPKESQFSSAVAEGEVNMKLHNWQKALNAFTRAVSLGPKSKHVLVCRSKCYQNLGRFDLAIQDADTALSYDTNYYKVCQLVQNNSRGIFAKGRGIVC